MSYCITTIDGNLTANPKKVTIGGTEAVEISIAVNYNVKGEKQTSFYRVLFFAGDEATYLEEKAKTGSRITVIANTRTVKKDTTTYTNYTGINVLQLFTPQKEDTPTSNEPATTSIPPKEDKPATKVDADVVEDDLPF